MSQTPRHIIAWTIEEPGLVPIYYEADADKALDTLTACYEAGIRAFEFTNRGTRAHQVFERLALAKEGMPGLALGVGTIIDEGTAALYAQLGADFFIMPYLNADVARMCNRRGLLWAAGCATLTEIGAAQELGAALIKVFPAGGLGPGFIKGALGPMPWTRMMPTGGVIPDRDNLTGWIKSGAVCVGMGSQLFEGITSPEALSTRVKDCLKWIAEARPQRL